MSGICGIVNFDGAPVDSEVLKKMAQAAAHRGPDGIRYHLQAGAGLANLALDVTPESVYEKQPLVSRDGDLILTADARVDNRMELIRTLNAKGYLPKDQLPEIVTDAEVILAAYRCWGEKCPIHIIGDFAFAVWDTARKRLFAARDTIGRRAFYYRTEPRRVLFASEVKQLIAVPGVSTRIFEPMVAAFLAGEGAFQEWTFYEGIVQLPPAHALAIDIAGVRTWRYWDIDPDFRIEYADEDHYAEHLAEIFLEAVRCRLRSIKPVGLYLSGGLDSGSIASAAGWLLRRPASGDTPSFHPYCFAFDELTQCDEHHISDGIVHHYGFPVTYVPADTAWPLRGYPAHGPDQDDPYLGLFQGLHERTLAIAQDERMGSMLTGGFGDIVAGLDFWDYVDRLRAGQWWSLWSDLRAHGRMLDAPMDKMVKYFVWNPLKTHLWPPGRAVRLRRLYRRTLRHPDPAKPYPDWIRPEFAKRVGLTDILRQSVPQAAVVKGQARRERYREAFDPFHTRGTVCGDRLRARFGMYETDPWADRRVIEFHLAVPQGVLNRAGENKRLTRRAMRGIMPEDVRQAATRIRITPLFDAGMKQHAVGTVLDLIADSKAEAAGYIDKRALAEYYSAFRRGEHNSSIFWYTLTLEMWLRRYWS